MVLAPCWATLRKLRRATAGPSSPTCALYSSAAMPGLPIYPLTCARRYCIRLPGRTMRARRKRREERKNERAGLQSAGKRRSPAAARAHRRSHRRCDLRRRRGEVSGTILSLLSSRLHVCSGAVTWLAGLAHAAASHRRRLGHYDSPAAGIGYARVGGGRGPVHSHLVWHEVSLLLFSMRRPPRRRCALGVPTELPDARRLPHSGHCI